MKKRMNRKKSDDTDIRHFVMLAALEWNGVCCLHYNHDNRIKLDKEREWVLQEIADQNDQWKKQSKASFITGKYLI
ncbi:hypothetical protein FRX31_029469 [Thalictrum thalictroides]|uniref:Uncharacterized protein n=1 Tax=Thalictrum thalictroides TaxID=46969 RepID=A0A7J6V746_THATH|nr:hypothetical protein FRX31_029469 [Thalictrum thalictroides]